MLVSNRTRKERNHQLVGLQMYNGLKSAPKSLEVIHTITENQNEDQTYDSNIL